MENKIVMSAVLPTRFGKVAVETTAAGLYRITLPAEGQPDTAAGKTLSGGGPDARRWMELSLRLLKTYFEGKPACFAEIPLDLSGYSLFETRVLSALAAVPRGELVSYGALGLRAGSAGSARAVGQVMNRNRIPVVIPCHRVIRSDGSPGGFACGLEWKGRLLALEGIDIAGPLPGARKKNSAALQPQLLPLA